jgi:hypothetical protein
MPNYIKLSLSLYEQDALISLRPYFLLGLRKFGGMETKARKVLIADDEPDILEILKYNLSNEGYEVITAKMAMKLWKKPVAVSPTWWYLM